MEEVQEMKTLVAHLFDCLKILNDTNRKMYENQQIIMKKIQNQENILKKFVNFYPRLQEQEHQQELLSKRFYEHVQTTNSEFERLKEKFENKSKVSQFHKANTETVSRSIIFVLDSTPSPLVYSPLSAQEHPLGLDPGELGPLEPVLEHSDTEEAVSIPDDDEDHNGYTDGSSVMKTLMNFQKKIEDDRCRRTIIISNLSLFKHESWHNGSLKNFWPRLRNTLRAVSLDFILRHNVHVKLCKSGALRITYDHACYARAIIDELKRRAARWKTLPRTMEDNLAILYDDITAGPVLIPDQMYDIHINLKFCLATPARHHKSRKILEKLARKLKKENKIVYFDFIVHGDNMILKTLWKKTNFQQTSSGIMTLHEKCYTCYSVDMAEQILSGLISVTEREHASRHNRQNSREL